MYIVSSVQHSITLHSGAYSTDCSHTGHCKGWRSRSSISVPRLNKRHWPGLLQWGWCVIIDAADTTCHTLSTVGSRVMLWGRGTDGCSISWGPSWCWAVRQAEPRECSVSQSYESESNDSTSCKQGEKSMYRSKNGRASAGIQHRSCFRTRTWINILYKKLCQTKTYMQLHSNTYFCIGLSSTLTISSLFGGMFWEGMSHIEDTYYLIRHYGNIST